MATSAQANPDDYCQWAVVAIPGTAATSGTTVSQLQTGITNLQKVAWEVYRMEYWVPVAWLGATVLNAAGQYITLGLTQSASTSQNITPQNPSGVDWISLGAGQQLSSVGYVAPYIQPFRHDFPGMPVLALPQNLYGMLTWATAANLNTSNCLLKLWYKEVTLGPQNWYDLLQLRLPLGAST
jgi:hypothetical protein